MTIIVYKKLIMPKSKHRKNQKQKSRARTERVKAEQKFVQRKFNEYFAQELEKLKKMAVDPVGSYSLSENDIAIHLEPDNFYANPHEDIVIKALDYDNDDFSIRMEVVDNADDPQSRLEQRRDIFRIRLDMAGGDKIGTFKVDPMLYSIGVGKRF